MFAYELLVGDAFFADDDEAVAALVDAPRARHATFSLRDLYADKFKRVPDVKMAKIIGEMLVHASRRPESLHGVLHSAGYTKALDDLRRGVAGLDAHLGDVDEKLDAAHAASS